jgi:DNA repair exonuclease SbcCD ATPase subunit
MTTTNIAAKIAIAHEASLQERERGRLQLEESLRKSNAALAAEVLRLREDAHKDMDRCDRYAARIAELEAESRDFKALGKRCEEAERRYAIADQCAEANIRELHRADNRIGELTQQLAEANARAGLPADGFIDRDMTTIGNALGIRGKFRDDFGTMQMADAATKQASGRDGLRIQVADAKRECEGERQNRVEAEERLARAEGYHEATKRELEAAVQQLNEMRSERNRAQAELAEVKAKLCAVANAIEALDHAAKASFSLELIGFMMSVRNKVTEALLHGGRAATPPAPQPETAGEERREVRAGDVVEWIDSLGDKCIADVVIANEREGAFIKPRSHPFVVQAWVSQSRVRIVPDHSSTPSTGEKGGEHV